MMVQNPLPSHAHYPIHVGDEIPSFFIRDHEGFEISEEDIIGSLLILYYYPEDETLNCIKELCAFRDAMKEMDRLDAWILGVSPDPAKVHCRLIKEHHLNFTLLCDENLEFGKKFGVVRDEGKIEQTTFVIDADGIIQWIERPVNFEGHIERVIEAVKKSSRSDEALQRFIEQNIKLRQAISNSFNQ